MSFAPSIINLEVIPEQFLSPVNLFWAMAFYIYEALKVIMVYKHKNFMFATFEIVLPSFEYLNNCQ